MATATETPGARTVDMKLEAVVIPVADVDRAKRFYGGLGWRLDADFPFENVAEASHFIDTVEIDEALRRKICWDNPKRVLRLAI